MTNNNQSKSLKFTIDRFEGEMAVLDGEVSLDIPKKFIPKDAKEGDSLVLTITTDEAETKHKTLRAKDLLNEILGRSSK